MWNDTWVRLGVTVVLLGVFAALEARWPRRARRFSRGQRWPSNLGIVALDQLAVRAFVPVLPVAWAALVYGGGLFGRVDLPAAVEAALGVIALDLAIWLQHVSFHRVPILWRLHRMHHADPDFDVTTALRFHPVEILLSVVIKLGMISLLGVSPGAVLAFELILNGMAMFNHANLALPLPVDAVLRKVVVTPDVHRVHHSVLPAEANANFGFNLVIWDRMFGTWRAQPLAGHAAMEIGDRQVTEDDELRLDRVLTQPARIGT